MCLLAWLELSPVDHSGFEVVYMRGVIYGVSRPPGPISTGDVLWRKEKQRRLAKSWMGELEAPYSPVTVPLAAVAGLVAH